jgi:hypothetical protein
LDALLYLEYTGIKYSATEASYPVCTYTDSNLPVLRFDRFVVESAKIVKYLQEEHCDINEFVPADIQSDIQAYRNLALSTMCPVTDFFLYLDEKTHSANSSSTISKNIPWPLKHFYSQSKLLQVVNDNEARKNGVLLPKIKSRQEALAIADKTLRILSAKLGVQVQKVTNIDDIDDTDTDGNGKNSSSSQNDRKYFFNQKSPSTLDTAVAAIVAANYFMPVQDDNTVKQLLETKYPNLVAHCHLMLSLATSPSFKYTGNISLKSDSAVREAFDTHVVEESKKTYVQVLPSSKNKWLKPRQKNPSMPGQSNVSGENGNNAGNNDASGDNDIPNQGNMSLYNALVIGTFTLVTFGYKLIWPAK